MAPRVLFGNKFPGVEYGTAPGDGYIVGFRPGDGYIIGFRKTAERAPLGIQMLLVEDPDYSACLRGVKYAHHARGDSSPGPRGPSDEERSLTMLVSNGCWRQRLWSEKGDYLELMLWKPGDFIAWEPGIRHSWVAEEASTMLSIRWKPMKKGHAVLQICCHRAAQGMTE